MKISLLGEDLWNSQAQFLKEHYNKKEFALLTAEEKSFQSEIIVRSSSLIIFCFKTFSLEKMQNTASQRDGQLFTLARN